MNKKIALVTGSAKRIGREIVIHLANNNYQPLIHYNQSANDAKNLKKSFDQAMDKVQKELLRIVAEVAEESEVGVVLFRSAIVIAVKKLDISKEVLRRLNKKLPDVEVRFEMVKGSK